MKKHGDKIRAYFRPVEKYENVSRDAIDSPRREADIVIGVHIRQGDYRGWKGWQIFFPAVALRGVDASNWPCTNRKVVFFVCSDEPRSLGEFPGLTVSLGTDSPVSDIYALARCDYILGTKSTFSQWPSFYGEKPLLQVQGTDAGQNRKISASRIWIEL